MALATLSIDIVAQIASLQAGLDKAGRMSEKTAAQIERNFAGLRTGALAVGTALSGAFAGVGLTALINSTLKGVDALNDISDATGSTVENISALEDVALRTGSSIDTVQTSLIKFNKVLSEANGSNAAGEALRKIGLDAEALKKLDPAEALLQTAQALAVYADDGDKARLVQELFGKSLKEVAPFLNDLAKQTELVSKVTAEQAREAEKFNQQLDALQKNAVDLAREFAGPLAEAFNAFGDSIKGQAGFFRELSPAAQAVLVPLQALAVVGANVAFVFEQVGGAIRASAAAAAAAARGQFAAVGEIFRSYNEEAAQSRAELDAFEKRILRISDLQGRRPANEGGGKFIALKVGSSGGRTRGAASSRAQAVQLAPVPKELLDAIRAIEQTDTFKIAELTAQLQALLSLRPEGGDAAIDQAIGKVRQQLEALDPAAAAAAESQRRLNELLAATPTAQLEATREQMQFLAKAFEDGKISAEQYGEAVQAALGSGAREEIEKTNDFAKDLGLTFSSAFEDAIVEGKKFKEVLKGLGDDILRILTRKALTEPLANAIGGFDFGSLFASAKGNAFGPSGVIPFAKGGIVDGPTIFPFAKGIGLMGEAGPEAILPLKRGAGGALGVQASGSSAPVIKVEIINNNAGQSTARAEQSPNGLRVVIDAVRQQLGAEIAGGRGLAAPIGQRFGLNGAAGLSR